MRTYRCDQSNLETTESVGVVPGLGQQALRTWGLDAESPHCADRLARPRPGSWTTVMAASRLALSDPAPATPEDAS